MEKGMFNENPELKAKAARLTKHEAKLDFDGETLHVLMGTDLVYEDFLWNAMLEAVKGTCSRMGLKAEDDDGWVIDASSELRDKALELIASGLGVDFVTGSGEY